MSIEMWKAGRMTDAQMRWPVGSLAMFNAPGVGLVYGKVCRWFWDSWSLMADMEYDGDHLLLPASFLEGGVQ